MCFSNSEPLRLSKPRILVVDDEHVLADLLAHILNETGFFATAVYGGFAALRISERFGPDVVVTDVDMPDINGVQAAVEIKKRDPLCGVILVSGIDPEEHADWLTPAVAEGFEFDVIPKPIHPGTLISRIGKLLGIRQAGFDPNKPDARKLA